MFFVSSWLLEFVFPEILLLVLVVVVVLVLMLLLCGSGLSLVTSFSGLLFALVTPLVVNVNVVVVLKPL